MEQTQNNEYHAQRMRIAEQEEYLLLIEKLKPKFSKDGNQFCYLYGENPMEGISGFGHTVERAVYNFWRAFHDDKALKQD